MSAADFDPQPRRPRWEYLVISSTAEAADAQLATRGDDGWELVNFETRGSIVMFVFKRQKGTK